MPDPVFPPLLTGHAVKAPQRAFDAAVRGAMAGDFGGGDLVWARDTARLDCALVLEPEVAPERAVEMIFVAMVAFGDCFGAVAPPEVAVTYGWPTTLKVNGGAVGAVRAAMSAERDEAGAPRWLVIGLTVEMRSPRPLADPGMTPDVTNLYEEGCGEITRTELLESYSRHLLAWIHDWETDGFRGVHEMVLFRADGYREEVSIELAGERVAGRFAGLDDHGNLLLEQDGKTRLLDAMKVVEIDQPAEAVR